MSSIVVERPSSRHAATAEQLPLVTRALIWSLAMSICFPRFLDRYVMSQYMLIVGFLLTVVVHFAVRMKQAGPRLLAAVGLSLAAYLVADLFLRPDLLSVTYLPRLGTFLLILPAGIAAGFALMQEPGLARQTGRAYLTCALAAVPLAVYESFNRVRLLPLPVGTGNQELNRAVVGQDHPITLGLVLACAIPLLTPLSFRKRLIGCVVLYFGVLCTGSAGPEFVGALAVTAVLWRAVVAFAARMRMLLTLGALCVIGLVAHFATAIWQPVIIGNSVDAYSNGYRTAAYSLLPRILSDAPFGFGPDSIPDGRYLIYSTFLGVTDLAQTIDAEPVLIASKFGWAGLLFLIVVLLFAIRALKTSPVPAVMAILLMLGGTVVALDAWPSISAGWAILIGTTISASRQSPPASGSGLVARI